jgi:nucleotide-binding universal stress UspA family protein
MSLKEIVAAADESDAGRHAVRTAVELAARCSAQVTIMRVIAREAAPRFAAVGGGTGDTPPLDHASELGRLHRWLEAGVLASDDLGRVRLGVAYGIPGIEICRFADEKQADLVVLGRKRHSRMMRLLLGDTADAVARRSRCPSLFIPLGSRSVRRMLVALNGSKRGMRVLQQACELARDLGCELQAITVEQGPGDEPAQLAGSLPLARTTSLRDAVHELLSLNRLPDTGLIVRRGEPVEEIVAAAQETGADILVLGHHRGGPPGVLEAGSTARRLTHASPCAVLTVPL